MRTPKNTLIKLMSLAIAGYVVSAPVNAASPIPYDSWTESAGVISAACPVGFGCMGDSSDQGMMQRILFDSNGDQYIHQVITESTPTQGNMTLEAFVFSSNGTAPSGIASKQHIYHDEASKSMDVLVYLNTGWANTGENVVQVNQSKNTTENNNPNIYYEDSFTFYERRDTTTQAINGKYIDISQGQLGSTYFQSDGGVLTSGSDQYSFVNRQVSGVFNPVAMTASLTNYWTGSLLDANGATGGATVSWDPGDSLRMVWWGQLCTGCAAYSANMSLQILENLTTETTTAGQRRFVTSPMSWPEPPFGTAPSIIEY